MILALVKSTDPILFTRTPDFDFSDPPIDPEKLALDLIETMRAHRGYGLSANQCGLPYRVFVMDAITPFVCFNPKIVDMSEELSPPLEEACLSFPGISLKVRRPMTIRVRFTTPNGSVTTKTFMGMSARCFVHETMHLNGYPFFEGLGRVKLERAIKTAKKHGHDYTGQNLLKHAGSH